MQKKYFYGGLFFLILALSVAAIQSCKNNAAKNKQADNAKSIFRFREKLSEYGFFKDKLSDLHPRENVIPYQLATPLFTDYAVKDRFIVLPEGASITYTAAGPLEFPDSTIIIKNFAYTNVAHQKIMIETRLLVKDPSDSKWKVMNYLWNAEQTDAVKHITGSRQPVTLLNEEGEKISTVYQVPNTNDCKRCHVNNNMLIPIGPKARNLNYAVPAQKVNQLAQWAARGKLSGLPDSAKVEQLPDWKDVKRFNIEQRARAYLDINCAHCHTKGGDAYNTGLFLEYEQTDKHYIGIMKAPVSAGNGAGGFDYDIIPGDAAHSILAYRMNSTEAGTAMPELARTVIHKEGVKLIMDWINSMK
ncbi:SO2930 family diheme c-type cytochrome [Agriterribacter sp.]|uniref:SO2930 family diheme c-type cytochrome n=1 Tax=Agriterribacter sp. TaxID=2821509 RepID=UPI002BD92B67|nr:SO2930 family diheme c-type cytochrome [Agriterribacter sp.]HTN08922.1 SO2930 family diheme c-type cytochrome [Agriterribacter sp.]